MKMMDRLGGENYEAGRLEVRNVEMRWGGGGVEGDTNLGWGGMEVDVNKLN